MARVLISGAGVAGAVLAYWLGKNGFQVVVIERSPSRTEDGQIIDVEGPSREIVERMGVIDEIQTNITHEAGVRFFDEHGRPFASFPAGKVNVSKEIEIMRPALARILLSAADGFPNVEFRYGRTIQSLQRTETSVTADIQDRGTGAITKEEFDILVACDGLRSKTRDMILPPSERKSCVESTKFFVAFFSIPAEPQDRPWANLFSAPGRRSAFTKPWTEQETSAYLTCGKFDQKLHDARKSRDVKAQKERLAYIFEGLGWETERPVRGMMDAQNFYFEEISLVMLDRWSHGRCALLGDTAYCPSPLTGQGTNLAILGAYVLAYHLVTNREDFSAAFEQYEKDMRPYVNKVQPIPLRGYLPLLLNPDTTWGVWMLRTLTSWVSWLQPWKWFPDLGKGTPYALPEL
ncbi:MAG: hypothetical protein Q9219_003491 [cf. Caloplaca sp. 3 TL-2023]